MTDYKQYPPNTRVRIKSTGEEGEAFESLLGYITVFLNDGECEYYKLGNVEFLAKEVTE